ncbi:MAG: glycoside hydrolase family 36 N-terminal domain-containing protein, partial [Herbiconiux sp.]|nr:glycoside hydrolase family 36 N-terminal domain-containing protein [Herbiconiux sp.]
MDLPRTQHHVLRHGGVEVAIVAAPDGLPEVLHWGAPLGAADREELVLSSRRQVSPSALDAEWPLTLLPGEHDGWEGRPGLSAHRAGRIIVPRWRVVELKGDETRLVVTAQAAGIGLRSEMLLDSAGILRVTHEIVNDGVDELELLSLEATMPVGDLAAEALDFSGRWTRERSPQRSRLLEGSRVRETRRGRTGHDSPMLSTLGTAGFGDRTGEVWA